MENNLPEVKLVAITQPKVIDTSTPLRRELTPDQFIAYVARVSNPSNQMNTGTADKLVGYLIRNNHWSPLELISIVMEITTTRDIARQILRHRSFSFQEFSQRYADPTEDLGFVTREARLQDPKNRQNSIAVEDASLQDAWKSIQAMTNSNAQRAYEWAIENGIAKEQARAVLPEGLTVSRMYMSGTLRSWIHYVQLRSANGTQKEHMEVAQKCKDILAEYFPSIRSILE